MMPCEIDTTDFLCRHHVHDVLPDAKPVLQCIQKQRASAVLRASWALHISTNIDMVKPNCDCAMSVSENRWA